MAVLRCTRKLLDRLGQHRPSEVTSTTSLGDRYATVLFTKPPSPFWACVSPRHENPIVCEFEQPLGLRCPQEFRNSPAPDVDPFREPSGLTDARDHDDRRDGFTEQEVLVLSQEEHLWTGKSRADSGV